MCSKRIFKKHCDTSRSCHQNVTDLGAITSVQQIMVAKATMAA